VAQAAQVDVVFAIKWAVWLVQVFALQDAGKVVTV
jgi:hypothetical protein